MLTILFDPTTYQRTFIAIKQGDITVHAMNCDINEAQVYLEAWLKDWYFVKEHYESGHNTKHESCPICYPPLN